MADNTTQNGTANIATDDIGGVHYQIAKLDFGPLDTATLVATGSGLPISGTVELGATSLAALETVGISGTVPVSGAFYQATQPVSAAALPLPTGAATEATISALQTLMNTLAGTVQLHNSVFSDGSPGQIMLAKRRDADTTAVADGDLNILNMDEEGRLKVASKPASYAATTGNVIASTTAIPINTERFSNLMIHCTGTFAGVNCTFEGSLNSTNGTDGSWFTVQAIRSNANTIETTTGVLGAAPAYAWELSVNALKYFRVRATAWTSGTQVWTMIPGTYATEPIPGAAIHTDTTAVAAGQVKVKLSRTV